MGFFWDYIGRPSTSWDMVTTLRNVLLSVGWTEVYNNNTDTVVLKTAPYTPQRSDYDWGSAHLLLQAVSSYVNIQMGQGWDFDTNTLIPPTVGPRRLDYGYVTSYYYLYANEFWFWLNPARTDASIPGIPAYDSGYVSFAGVALPPRLVENLTNIHEIPPTKMVFLAAPYDTSGTLDAVGDILRSSYADIHVPLYPPRFHQYLPELGVPSNLTGGMRAGWFSSPISWFFISNVVTTTRVLSNTSFSDRGILPYSLVINTTSIAHFEFKIGSRKYVLLRGDSFGRLWARVS